MRTHDLMIDFGNGILAGTGTAIRILDYDGLGSLPTKANVIEHAILDGGVLASLRAGTRRLMFQLDFIETDLGWADVPRLFPQGGPYELVITRDGVTRTIEAYRDTELIPLGDGGAGDSVAYQLALLAPDPYLKGTLAELAKSAAITGGLAFPVTFDPIAYESIDVSTTTGVFAVLNDGDYPVGFDFDFIAAVTCSPQISIGQDVMVFASIAAGQRLTVDTKKQTVRLNGANAFSLLVGGTFLRIPTGAVSVALAGIVGTAVLSFTPVHEAI
jgi:hypothetical protein